MSTTITEKKTEGGVRYINVDGRTIEQARPDQVIGTATKLGLPTTKKFIVPARPEGEGVGTYGLYAEVVYFASTNGQPVRHTRYFVYDQFVYAATRTADQDKMSAWRPRKCSSLAHALNIVQDQITRETSKVYGRILLVELKPDDVSAIEAGQVPGARYRGQYRIERDFDKFDFDRDIDSLPSEAWTEQALNRLTR